MGKLGTHRGKPIMGATVKITNAGDGLAKPLAAEPRDFPPGAYLPVLVWCKVGDEDYDPVEVEGSDDDDETEGNVIGYKLKFNFKAREAFVLDRVKPKVLDDLVADQREAVRIFDLEEKRKKAEAKGEMALEGTEPGGPVDGGPERPEGISDADWEASARGASVSPIGSKVAKKAEATG